MTAREVADRLDALSRTLRSIRPLLPIDSLIARDSMVQTRDMLNGIAETLTRQLALADRDYCDA